MRQAIPHERRQQCIGLKRRLVSKMLLLPEWTVALALVTLAWKKAGAKVATMRMKEGVGESMAVVAAMAAAKAAAKEAAALTAAVEKVTGATAEAVASSTTQ